jgi:uncharacterized surface protein with fasciclin (FAS1) repeats
MRKKLIVSMIVVLAVILVISALAVPAFAKKDLPGNADGIWCYLPGPPNPADFDFGYRIGENDFFTGSYDSDWSGIFTGSSQDNGLVIWRNFPADGPAMFVDLITFDSVEVGGKTGGLELYLYGERETNFWSGSWFIAGASGELEGLEGRGQWWQWQDVSDGGCAEGYIPVHYSVVDLRGLSFEEVVEPVPSDNTIVDIAVADGRFDTLVAAVTFAGLADALSGGEWTVFAPTDDAFAKLDLNANNITSAFTKEELTDILLYHALAGSVDEATAKVSQGNISMANGQIAGLKVFEDELYINDDSKVIISDIFADNGVIHVVDTVILGPWPRAE